MRSAEEFVAGVLAHYASPYYDPAKAHEYYLKNRELADKRSSSGLTVKYDTRSKNGKTTVTKVDKERTDERQQAWAYAKNQIGEKQKADAVAASEAHKAEVERLQEGAKARREEITGKLQDLLKAIASQRPDKTQEIADKAKSDQEALEAKQKEESARIREEAAKKVAALPPIPKGVSDEQRARLTAQRSKEIADINGAAQTDLKKLADKTESDKQAISDGVKTARKDLSDKLSNDRKAESDKATAERDAVSNDLKVSVDKAREGYEAIKEHLKAQYEATSQQEYDAIKARV